MPDGVGLGSTFAQVRRDQGPEMIHPAPNGLVGDHDAAFRQQVFDVTEAQCEPEIEPDRLLDDLWRKAVAAIADFLHSRGYRTASGTASPKRRDKASGHVALDFVEELAELLGAVARHAFADDRSRLHIERSEQRRRAVAFVVVGAPLDLTRPQWQQRLGAVQRLDLALFIDTEHQSPLRRVEGEADNVTLFFNELRISRKLERLAAMRSQRERMPDAMHCRDGYAGRSRHRACSNALRRPASSPASLSRLRRSSRHRSFAARRSAARPHS